MYNRLDVGLHPVLTWRHFALVLLLAGVAAAQTAPAPSKPAASKTTRKAKPSALRGKSNPPPALAEAPPPRPLTRAEMPAVAPQVTYQDGQLSISASNSTLADILTLVKRQTGATVEFPPAANNDRVVTQLGPASPSDVLAKLLNGSPYDYIILGSPTDARAVQRVLITQRQGGPMPSGALAGPASGQPQLPVMRGSPPPPEDESEEPPEEVTEQPSEEPPPPTPQQQSPFGQGQPGAPQGQPGVKTPEQLLEELQRMQQQQQEQQRQPQQAPPNDER